MFKLLWCRQYENSRNAQMIRLVGQLCQRAKTEHDSHGEASVDERVHCLLKRLYPLATRKELCRNTTAIVNRGPILFICEGDAKLVWRHLGAEQ